MPDALTLTRYGRTVPPSDGRLPDWAYRFTMLCVLLYAFRDTLTGSIRYYLDMIHLSTIWFIPDVLAFGCLAIFGAVVVRENRSVLGAMFVVNFFTAALIGLLFMNQSGLAFTTAIKCVLPIFVGMTLSGRSLTEQRNTRIFLFTMMMVSVSGLMLSPLIEFPWVGAEINNFGFAKTVGKLWWEGGIVRYGGFAGDSTMAAFMTIFPYFLLYRHMPRWAVVALWPLLYYAVHISTSKTAMSVLVLFAVFYLMFYVVGAEIMRRKRLDKLVTASFVCVAIPFVLIFILGEANLTTVSPTLFSLQDRIDNSWQLPFSNLAELFPAGLLTGCGLGCFSYPMTYTEMARYWVPVDNFYLTTYLMMGVPFLILVMAQAASIRQIRDETKLVLVAVINIYTMMVACYGPSFATIVVGYTFSDLFLSRTPTWRRRGLAVPEFATA